MVDLHEDVDPCYGNLCLAFMNQINPYGILPADDPCPLTYDPRYMCDLVLFT